LRIGLLVPSSNTTIEPEFNKMAPSKVTVHSTRMMLKEITSKAMLKMADEAEKGTELLSSAGVDVIIYGCSTCSLMGGVDWEEVLINQLEFQVGTKVITTNKAVIEAIEQMGGGKVGVVTPYREELNRLEKRYLQAHGLNISSIKGLGLENPEDISNVNEISIIELLDDIIDDSDIIYISCTNLPTINIIEKLERKHKIPVITGNQASMWAALKHMKYDGITGYGRLFNK